ncbi:lipoate--protein ligase family protein [Candidatus Poribacteria bacterium]|nr:lipoate--protein ligase family protein [Candidatus Poribacteria bacterium]
MKTVGRLLNMGANSAAMNMAIDEAILLGQQEHPKPTLRFYEWSSPAFSFGYFQDIASEVDVEACRADGIELVKRMTGGGTVVHGWELTYTLVLPRAASEMGISDTYQRIGHTLVKAFQKLGVPAQCYTECPNPSESVPNICLTNPAEHDVMSGDKKLAGVSVRRNRKGIMFQGYITLDMPPSFILKRVSKDPEVQQSLHEKSTAINVDGRFITRDVVIQTVCETFEFGIPFNSGKLSLEECAQAATLAETKYATSAWNFG